MCFFQLSWKQKLTFQADRPVLTELRACDIVKGLCRSIYRQFTNMHDLAKASPERTVQMSRDESAFQFAVVIGELVKYQKAGGSSSSPPCRPQPAKDQISSALACLVDAIHAQPFATLWGDGETYSPTGSSSGLAATATAAPIRNSAR